MLFLGEGNIQREDPHEPKGLCGFFVVKIETYVNLTKM